jgi:hypothetical protein
MIGRHLEEIRHGQRVIQSFRLDVYEKYAVLGYYAASSCNYLQTFRDNLRDRMVVPKRR